MSRPVEETPHAPRAPACPQHTVRRRRAGHDGPPPGDLHAGAAVVGAGDRQRRGLPHRHPPRPRSAVAGRPRPALHLVIFTLVLPWSVPETANVVAFLTATQVNFALSYSWTWSSRRPPGRETVGYVIRRAFLFNGSALLGFSLNAVAFSTAYRIVGMPPPGGARGAPARCGLTAGVFPPACRIVGMPRLGSAVVATAASAAASFLLSSRVVFTR